MLFLCLFGVNNTNIYNLSLRIIIKSLFSCSLLGIVETILSEYHTSMGFNGLFSSSRTPTTTISCPAAVYNENKIQCSSSCIGATCTILESQISNLFDQLFDHLSIRKSIQNHNGIAVD